MRGNNLLEKLRLRQIWNTSLYYLRKLKFAPTLQNLYTLLATVVCGLLIWYIIWSIVQQVQVVRCQETIYIRTRWDPKVVYLRADLANDITMATHMNVDRFDALKAAVERWPGPIALALYLKDVARDMALLHRFIERYDPERRIEYVVYNSNDHLQYPVNILRNLVLRHVNTKMVLLLDADFVPNRSMYHNLMAKYDELWERMKDSVFVTPAFEFKNDTMAWPEEKADVVRNVRERSMQPILEHYPAAHVRALDYPRWYEATEDYQVQYQDLWEPYLLMPTAQIPPFDERFVYYGNDKVQHIYHLDHRDYKFYVLPDAFVTHYPHAAGKWFDPVYRWAVFEYVVEQYEVFKQELLWKEPRKAGECEFHAFPTRSKQLELENKILESLDESTRAEMKRERDNRRNPEVPTSRLRGRGG